MVATDWAALGQTAVGAAAAIGGGLLGSWMQGRGQERLERHRRRERFAEVLADVMSLLDDINPARQWFGHRISDIEAFDKKTQGRVATIRTRLLVLAAGHPDAYVRDLARRLDKAVDELAFVVGLLVDLQTEPDTDPAEITEIREEAKGEYGRSEGLLNELLKVI